MIFPTSKVPNRRGLSRKHILASIEETLNFYLEMKSCYLFIHIPNDNQRKTKIQTIKIILIQTVN